MSPDDHSHDDHSHDPHPDDAGPTDGPRTDGGESRSTTTTESTAPATARPTAAALPAFDDRDPSLSASLTAAVRLLRDFPAAVFPAYLLALGTASVARVPVLLGVAAATALLATTGRIEPVLQAAEPLFREAQATTGEPSGGPFGGGGIFGGDTPPDGASSDPGFSPELEAALADLVTPETVLLVLGGGALALVVGLLVRAVAVAVAQSTVWATFAVADGRGAPATDDTSHPTDDSARATDDAGRTTGVASRASHVALTDGIRGAGRWQTFLGLALVRLLVAAVLVGGSLLVTGVLTALSPAAIVLGVLGTLAAVAVTLVVLLVLSFANPAAVVDDRSVAGAIRGSLGFVRRHPGETVVFGLVAAGLYVGAGVAAGALSAAGAGRVGGLFVPLAVSPLVDLLATGLYAGVRRPSERLDHEAATDREPTPDRAPPADRTAADERLESVSAGSTEQTDTTADDDGFEWVTETEPAETGVDAVPERGADATAEGGDEAAPGQGDDATTDPGAHDTGTGTRREPSRRADTPPLAVSSGERRSLAVALRGLFGGGLRRCLGFVPRHSVAVVVATLAFVAGGAGGWAVVAPSGIAVPPPGDVQGVFGAFPVSTFANIAANNWLVAVSGAFGGLAFAVPAATAAAFNGAVIGALAAAFDPRALVALVAPHGVIELPILVVAWGMGLHLGAVGWRGVRGRVDAATVAGRLQTVASGLAGVAVLLVVASFVEAFLTPQIAALVLG
ncbi:stage II sporulation protein M [Halobaculum sp. MBLA0147]|uniref:stage II sporulation protein M n=1 Tax=Halobaculum sp. MBLA0147 TaxID=3079934 RepID=UPI0035241FBF